ncbi:hypothetical protein BU15DRAFT_67700 [Melanogaster broomeanus]|nr:hypothetical protein BU15DRAFT_67700 [Melanogaster broomeanus]
MLGVPLILGLYSNLNIVTLIITESVVHSRLFSRSACAVAAQSGHTKDLQTVELEHGIKIIHLWDKSNVTQLKVEGVEDPIAVWGIIEGGGVAPGVDTVGQAQILSQFSKPFELAGLFGAAGAGAFGDAPIQEVTMWNARTQNQASDAAFVLTRERLRRAKDRSAYEEAAARSYPFNRKMLRGDAKRTRRAATKLQMSLGRTSAWKSTSCRIRLGELVDDMAFEELDQFSELVAVANIDLVASGEDHHQSPRKLHSTFPPSQRRCIPSTRFRAHETRLSAMPISRHLVLLLVFPNTCGRRPCLEVEHSHPRFALLAAPAQSSGLLMTEFFSCRHNIAELTMVAQERPLASRKSFPFEGKHERQTLRPCAFQGDSDLSAHEEASAQSQALN